MKNITLGLLILFSFPSFATGEISVLSQNLWGLPAILVKNKNTRIKAFCEMLKSRIEDKSAWDLVMLQEVWKKKDQAALTKCGYPYSARAETKSMQSGVMLLSKYPIVESRRMKYNVRADRGALDAELFAHKSALFALIRHPDLGRIWTVNTHLASGDNVGHNNVATRIAQFKQLSAAVHALPTNDGIILGGDLNTGAGDAYDASWETFITEFPEMKEAEHAPQICTYCPPNVYAKHNNGKIDHLLSSQGLVPSSGEVALTEPFQIPKKSKYINYSDHFAWESTFVKN